MPESIAILCCARNSVYKTLPDCDCFDEDRDARTFAGGKRCVGHPPCRCFSAFCQHQAKPANREEEMALGVWCVDQVRRWGGVIEQPAHSRLWDVCALPKPGSLVTSSDEVGFSIEIPQFGFGDAREKNTWLYIRGLYKFDVPEMPFRLKPDGGDRRIWQLMSSKNQRERTPKAFAEWLVECARRCKVTEICHA